MCRTSGFTLILCLLFIVFQKSTGHEPPGKPVLLGCRSPEKETFTCWWEPGSAGGLPTNYSLYYKKEGSDTVYECPDYKTAGKNSCYFDKQHTSIWINYNITVVATNALGRSFSDPLDVDVAYNVQPHAPENVTVEFHSKENPCLLVKWEPPHKADTKSGWITLIYEVRVKREKEDNWEEHFAGQQKQYNIFSLHPWEKYMVQVRCRPDHGYWSEWSSTAYVEIPDYIRRDRSMWILTSILSAFVFLIVIWTITIKRNSVKRYLLPPVPGPKIKGFDTQLLKSGKSEEMLSALVSQGFPPTNDCEDLLVEFLEVDDSDKRELVMNGKDHQEGKMNPAKSTSDNDSGRGSCDSHTLLLEKCPEFKVTGQVVRSFEQEGSHGIVTKERSGSLTWNGSPGGNLGNTETTNGKTKTWPAAFSFHDHEKPSHHILPEIQRPGYTTSNLHSMISQDDQLENNTEIRLSKTSTGYGNLQDYSEFNMKVTGSQMTEAPSFPLSKMVEYVEVQKVNQENILILKPKSKEGHEVLPPQFTGQEYTKVIGVANGNVLLLQRATETHISVEGRERTDTVENPCLQWQPGKLANTIPASPTQEGMQLAPNGYVETAPILPAFKRF
uniref:Prolactin receptor n=1 Tax=Lepisosteus oculatus TaxID=7918 RepID=W5N1N0_LEPOC